MRKMLGPHLAGIWIDKLELIRKWQPPFILVLQPKDNEVKQLREACPNAVIVGRFYHDDSYYADNILRRPVEFANEIHNEIVRDPVIQYLDYVQSNNETNQDWNGIGRLNQYTKEWMRLADQSGKYKCAILTFSVGNPDLPNKPGDAAGFNGRMLYWQQVLPSLHYAQDHQHLLLLHAYGYPTLFQPDAAWYIYRYEQQVANSLRQLGVNQLKYAYGEIGIDRLLVGAKGGYKVVTTPDTYVDQLFQWEKDQQKEALLLGGAIYTFGNSGGWESYDISDTPVAVTITTRYLNNAANYNDKPEDKPFEINLPQIEKETMALQYDPRLEKRGVNYEWYKPKVGEGYWKLIKAEYLDEKEHIFVNLLDQKGNRVYGKDVIIYWSSGQTIVKTEDKSRDPYALADANFRMDNLGCSYNIKFNEPSDKVLCEGLGSDTVHDYKIHRSGRYTFQWTVAQQVPVEQPPKAEPEKTYLPFVPNANTAGKPGTVTANILNVRDKANDTGKIIARIAQGTPVLVTQVQGDWYQVGQNAWVYGGWVQLKTLADPVLPEPTPGGAAITIDQFKKYLASVLGMDMKLVNAVFRAESGNRTWNEMGKVIIRTELHLLKKYISQAQFDQYFRILGPQIWEGHEWRENANAPWKEFHGNQVEEYKVHELAKRLNRNGAFESMSMGSAQILGSNHKILGYANAEEMYNEFAKSEAAQVAGFFAYVANTEALPALKRGDLRGFIASYNGPGQVDYYLRLINQYMQ